MNSPDGNVDLNHACNASVTEQEWHTCNSGVRVERPNVPEFMKPPFGPSGGGPGLDKLAYTGRSSRPLLMCRKLEF